MLHCTLDFLGCTRAWAFPFGTGLYGFAAKPWVHVLALRVTIPDAKAHLGLLMRSRTFEVIVPLRVAHEPDFHEQLAGNGCAYFLSTAPSASRDMGCPRRLLRWSSICGQPAFVPQSCLTFWRASLI